MVQRVKSRLETLLPSEGFSARRNIKLDLIHFYGVKIVYSMRLKGELIGFFIDSLAAKSIKQQPTTRVYNEGLDEFSPKKNLKT